MIQQVPSEDDDSLVSSALADAARRVRPEPTDKSFLEKRLAEALAEALAERFPRPDLVVRDKKLVNCDLPGWDPQPGTIDVAVLTPGREPRVAFELKIDDVEWTLWDIYKMASAAELPTVEAAYVAVAGTPAMWRSQRDCVELFDLEYPEADEPAESEDWDSRFLFRAYRKAWAGLLRGGRGRLTRAPTSIWITSVGRWLVPAYAPYEMRAIRVEAAGSRGAWIDFVDEWPSTARPSDDQEFIWGVKPIASDQLAAADLPDASGHDYHLFALSFDGYREMGSSRRCARIANESIERWRKDGSAPMEIDEVRACLFFEQRRWHHFGHGFDEETLAYVKVLIGRLRELLDLEEA